MKPGMFYVMREYSNTDRRHLLALESVPFRDERIAKDWKGWLESQSPQSRFVLVQVVDSG
jgi:hypothetical protein